MADFQRLPLFPLNTVLFPGMVLPLHIFEPRYRRMIYHCVTEDQPFGVVLIQEGQEVGGGATFHSTGTTAQITRVDPLGDGRINITTLGGQRFKIRDVVQESGEPYVVGLVEAFPLEDTQGSAARMEQQKLEPLLHQYLEILADAKAIDLDADMKMPDDAELVAYLTAMVLRLPVEQKQALLAIPALPDLLRAERHILRRENEVLKLLARRSPAWANQPLPFSPN